MNQKISEKPKRSLMSKLIGKNIFLTKLALEKKYDLQNVGIRIKPAFSSQY